MPSDALLEHLVSNEEPEVFSFKISLVSRISNKTRTHHHRKRWFPSEEELKRQPLDTATHFLHITGSKAQESYVLVTIPATILSILRRTVDSLVYLNVNHG